MMINTINKFKLMVAFTKLNDPKYGQELALELGMSKAKVYINLYELLEDGDLDCFVEDVKREGVKREPRQYYQATSQGRKEIEQRLRDWRLELSVEGVLRIDKKPFGTRSSLPLIQVFSILASHRDFIPASKLLVQTGLKTNTVYPMCRRAIKREQLESRYSQTLNQQNKKVTEYRLNTAGREATQIELSKLGLQLVS